MMRICLPGRARTRLLVSTCAWTAWLASVCLAAPPPATRAPARSPAVRRAPCYVVAVAHGSARTIERDQTLRTRGGDVIHAGKGDVILGGALRLAVLEVNPVTGATKPRAEAALDDDDLSFSAAAIRGDEIALQVYSGDGLASARIDLAAGRLEVSTPVSFEDMPMSRALASDGEAYYRYCKRDQLCRGKDWELRGNPIGLPSEVRFDEVAVAAGELYGFTDDTVHVIDLASKREIRRFAIPRDNRERGVGISGNELVTAGRDALTRYDRTTGKERGSVMLSVPGAFSGIRLTCGR